MLLEGGHALVADAYVVEEARRNLAAKFPEAAEALVTLLRQVEIGATASSPLKPEIAPHLPAKDRPVLAAAIKHQCQVLLTGDKTHFGPFYGQKLEGVEIHSPSSLAQKCTKP